VGTGAGLLIGGIYGAAQAASSADTARPGGEMRQIGLNRAFSPVGGRF
jgi:hypothetical protein